MSSSPGSSGRFPGAVHFLTPSHRVSQSADRIMPGFPLPSDPTPTTWNAGEQLELREQTRRHFFRNCGVGVGTAALGSLLLNDRLLRAATSEERRTNPFAPRDGHFPAKAKIGRAHV